MPHLIKRLRSTDTLLAKELIAAWQADGFAPKQPLPGDDHLKELMNSTSFHAIVALVDG